VTTEPDEEGVRAQHDEDVPVTDAALLRAARKDPRAFRELYDRHAEAVHGFHLRRSRNAEAALDLTAETFARAWALRDRFRDPGDGSAGPWLFAIARYVLLESVRTRRLESSATVRLGVLARLDREPASAEPSEVWIDGLDEAVEGLPDGLRRALELRVVDDLDYGDVAAGLGTTEGAARVRVARALALLRGRISSQQMEATR
jgi:RNA polymerase sigma factor (sigma-70 family)